MNRLPRISRIVVALLATGLIAGGGAPANAGALQWDDPADDATDFYVLTGTPLPSEPSLDIVKTTIASDDKALTWTLHLNKLAEAPGISPGYFFRFNFDYEGQGFAFRSGKDPAGEVLSFRVATDLVGFDLPCDGCEVKYDLDKSQVVLTVPIASFIAGVAAADTDCPACRDVVPLDPLPPLAKGSELTGIDVNAQYYYVRLTLNADSSVAPEGSTFVL